MTPDEYRQLAKGWQQLLEERWHIRSVCELDTVATSAVKKMLDMADEIDRLLHGDFTDEELQNLCHNLSESDYKAFCDGCDLYQRKLFGACRTDDISNNRQDEEV